MGIIKLRIYEKDLKPKLVKRKSGFVKMKMEDAKINPKISGNFRLKAGLYRTLEEQKIYIQKSLKRKLP